MTYQPTWDSLAQHPLPKWYDDAKLGIFVHWGLYSVPAWAPTGYSAMQEMRGLVPAGRSFGDVPDGAFYFDNLEIANSETRRYHNQTYGAQFSYHNFVPTFQQMSARFDPDALAELLSGVGARYVVLTTKHHEGFLMWRSQHPNPFLPQYMAQRDLLAELTTAVRKRNMRMGVYYSGGLDWTFNPGPITDLVDTALAIPQTPEYVAYCTQQYYELMERFEPSVLWNDIAMPRDADLPALFARYYNTVPDGVVDERWGQFNLGPLAELLKWKPLEHFVNRYAQHAFHGGSPPTSLPFSDFTTPEYTAYSTIVAKKWEATRAIGHSFGYNRNEQPSDYLTVPELVHSFVDIVSKNGNLLLNVGPTADGAIPEIERARLVGLGDWLSVHGDAIFDTRPWVRAEGKAHTANTALDVRFTQKGETLYATLLGVPSANTLVLGGLQLAEHATVQLLGNAAPLTYQSKDSNVVITLPDDVPNATKSGGALSIAVTPRPANVIP